MRAAQQHTNQEYNPVQDIERKARRLRTAEAAVVYARQTLDDEVYLVFKYTQTPVADLAKAAGRSCEATYNMLQRRQGRVANTNTDAD